METSTPALPARKGALLLEGSSGAWRWKPFWSRRTERVSRFSRLAAVTLPGAQPSGHPRRPFTVKYR